MIVTELSAAMAAAQAGITFGGAGAWRSFSQAAPRRPSPRAGGGQTIVIYIVCGDMFSGAQLHSLLEKISESMADGGRIIIAGESS